MKLSLLLVHAHPDDESINNGATMAKYVAAGVTTTLVTCTRGEEGEILIPELTHLASHKNDSLGDHRVTELADAMKIIGVTDFRFLGAPEQVWRDSGMVGTEPNNRPEAFANADIDKAAAELVKVILEVKPQVLITYDANGGYGHPDHIQANRVAMAAAQMARLAGWQIQKIYWNTIPRSVIADGIAAMKAIGSDFFGVESVDDFPFVQPDELATTVVDGNEYVATKMAAMKAHASQISVDGPFFSLADNLGLQVFGSEYYTLVYGEKSEPFDENGRETDIFAGVK